MQLRSLDLDGEVAYVDHGGQGDLVVLVHGLGASQASWGAAGPMLAQAHRVLAIDLPGFGRSPLAGRRASISAQRRILDRFLHAVADGPATLVGNSMGGMISIFEAAAAPERLRSLVLVNPSLPLPSLLQLRPDPLVAATFVAYGTPVLGRRFVAARKARLGPEGLVRATLALCGVDTRRMAPEVLEQLHDVARLRAEQAWADEAFLQAQRSILRVLLRHGRRYAATVAALEVPTLLVHGERDRLVPVESARAAARANPRVRFEELPRVGHAPQLSHPERFVDLVEGFLADLPTPTAAAPA